VCAALREGDVVVSNHRGHGHYLARTDDVTGLLAEIMGRASGACGGIGGSQHLYREGFYSNGVLGGTLPVAAGIADALRRGGPGRIAVVFMGDGALGEGVVYETLNIASKWKLPLLVVLENNRYAQSTPQEQTLAGDIEARAAAFAVPTAASSVWEPAALGAAARRAADAVRSGAGPFFLRVDCDRLMAHSKGDDLRGAAELEGYQKRDPLRVFAAENPADAERFQAEALARVDAATAECERAPVGALGLDPDGVSPAAAAFTRAPAPRTERCAALLHAALKRAMEKDPRIVLIGEDVEAPYGGAFKITRTLSTDFPGRVRNTPISEAAITGVGSGLALQGYLPVVEIMFGDFLTLAADQFINAAAKFRSMYKDQVRVPLIVRTPMGGRRGYGPTHSQSLEKHFLGVPGTRVLALNACRDPGLLYDALFRTVDRPTLVVENKLMYGLPPAAAPSGFTLELGAGDFPTSRLRPAGAADLTVLCYGGMYPLAAEAAETLFEKEEIACEVLCPEQLYPFDAAPLLESVARTKRLLIVEEGQGFAAFGAEAAAQVMERAPGALKSLKRLCAARGAIPSSGALEILALPSAAHIHAAALEMLHV
jgi:2-oxoisovalerate dehydrogenase E1 component